jgi:hypothetical protein
MILSTSPWIRITTKLASEARMRVDLGEVCRFLNNNQKLPK